MVSRCGQASWDRKAINQIDSSAIVQLLLMFHSTGKSMTSDDLCQSELTRITNLARHANILARPVIWVFDALTVRRYECPIYAPDSDVFLGHFIHGP